MVLLGFGADLIRKYFCFLPHFLIGYTFFLVKKEYALMSLWAVTEATHHQWKLRGMDDAPWLLSAVMG